MIKNLFIESNATGGVNRHCIAAMPPTEQWKCKRATSNQPLLVTATCRNQEPAYVYRSVLTDCLCVLFRQLCVGFVRSHTGACLRAEFRTRCLADRVYLHRDVRSRLPKDDTGEAG